MIIATVVSCLIIQIFYCFPIPAWDHLLTAKCIDTWAFYTAFGTWNVITNLVILMLPMYLVWNLRLRISDKIAIMFLFALGGFGCVAGIFRLIRLRPMALQNNYTYNSGLCAFWTVLEIYVAVICTCIPALRAFFLRYGPQVIKSTLKGRSKGFSTKSSWRVGLKKESNQIFEMEEGRRMCEMKLDHGDKASTLKSVQTRMVVE